MKEYRIREIWPHKEEVKNGWRDFPGGTVDRNPPANAGNMDLSPGPERSHMPQSS